MRHLGAAVLSLLALTACSGSTGSPPASTSAAAPSASGTSTGAASAPCPIDKAAVASLFGRPVLRVEGASAAGFGQICAFGTSSSDVSDLGVAYLVFPRPNEAARTLAQAYALYSRPLAHHRVTRMAAWGRGAFLDETVIAGGITAEFAYVPGYQIILGMHTDDSHFAMRRDLIDELVAVTR